METLDSNNELKSTNPPNTIKNNCSINRDIILCNHCKRTASNGIRCLGMCVADNDY